jgi:hypothetical protein
MTWKPEYNQNYKNAVIRLRHDDRNLHDKIIQLQIHYGEEDGEPVTASEVFRRTLDFTWETLCGGGRIKPRKDGERGTKEQPVTKCAACGGLWHLCEGGEGCQGRPDA